MGSTGVRSRDQQCTRVGANFQCYRAYHVLRRADVLAKVNRVETVLTGVVGVVGNATREVAVLSVVGGHLPREQARGDGEHLVALGVAAEGHSKGEHRLVVARGVVGKGEALGHGVFDHFHVISAIRGLLLAKELGVATRHVAGAHDVAKDHDVLRLGDDGLGAARQTEEGRELAGMSIVPHGRSSSVEW